MTFREWWDRRSQNSPAVEYYVAVVAEEAWNAATAQAPPPEVLRTELRKRVTAMVREYKRQRRDIDIEDCVAVFEAALKAVEPWTKGGR